MADTGSSRGFLHGLTQEENQKLEESTDQFRECVVRIIRIKKRREVTGIGTAFRVYNGNKRSLFLTCDHNFGKVKCGEVIRLYGRDDKDYPVAKILARSHYDKHDLLLFSVESMPEGKCLEFSTDKVQRKDHVVVLGYVSPTLPIGGQQPERLVLVRKTAPLTGVVVTEPFQMKDHEKIFVTCEATAGASGSPLLKSGKVIGVNVAADKDWREAVSSNTVLQVLREWVGVDNNNEDTFEELFEKAYNKFYPSD